MKDSNEITLRINGTMEDFTNDLIDKGFYETEHFILYDTFMIPSTLKIEEMTTREIISKAVIIRKVNDIKNSEIRQDMVYKSKKINEIGEIIEQKATRVRILNCKDAQQFLEQIGYKKILSIEEEDFEYQKDGFSLATKNLKNGDKMIETETDETFNTIDKLTEKIKSENLNLDYSNYFVKKAEVELDKKLNRK